MSRSRGTVTIAVAAGLTLGLGGCAAASSGGDPGGESASSRSVPGSVAPGSVAPGSLAPGSAGSGTADPPRTVRTDPQPLCARALPGQDLVAWARGTVAEFRAYRYGGPVPTVPLVRAFPGVPGAARGAWCGVRVAVEATRWWAVLPGGRPHSSITLHGPGEGTTRGLVAGPPRVP